MLFSSYIFEMTIGHMNTSYHYKKFVHHHQIHINNEFHNRQYKSYRIPISFVHLVFPTMISLIFGARAFLVLYYKAHINTQFLRLLLFTEFIPKDVRDFLEVCLLLWSLFPVLHSMYAMRLNILKYKFFAVLACNPDDKYGITPDVLGLSNFISCFFHIPKFVFVL